MSKEKKTRAVRLLPLSLVWLFTCLATLVFMLFDVSLFGLEERSLDLRFRLRGPQSTEHSPLILIEVDNRSYKDLDQRFPFPREYYAQLFKNLKRLGLSAVVLDIQFTEHVQGDDAGLEAFAEALRNGPPTVLSGERVEDRHGYFRLDAPLSELLSVQPNWGLVNDLVDRDGVNRLYPLSLPSPADSLPLPSLGVQLLDMLSMNPGTPHLEHGWSNAMRINYYGPRGSFPTYSFSDLMDAADFDLALPEMDSDYVELFADTLMYASLFGDDPHPFRDRIALVGVSAADLHDNKRTPFFTSGIHQSLMPGVEVHAHAIQTMLDQSWIWNPFFGWRLLLLLTLLALGMSWVVLRFAPLASTLLFLLGGSSWLLSAYWLFLDRGVWLEVISPLALFSFAWGSGMAFHLLMARRERAQIRGMFAHYVPEAVVSELIRDPGLLKLGGEERPLSALFSDVAGFTSISERLTPQELVVLLNEYLTAMTDCVTDVGGIIDKYEGDAIIAEFGAPLPCDDHALRAMRSAVAMQTRLESLRQEWAAQNRPELRARIGVNSGPMVVGNMGSRQIFDYTAMGDAMNLAARLEGVNKFYGSEILCSGDTWKQLDDKFLGRCLDQVRVKGKNESVDLWEVFGLFDSPFRESYEARCAAYNQGRALFQENKFQEAAAIFDQLAVDFPEDEPARRMAARARDLHEGREELPADGIRVLKDK